ncbi:MAG: pentapeptide repeat-containing protein [Thermomicrobiales bacterium]
MDAKTFDRLTLALQEGSSRRGVLVSAVVAALALRHSPEDAAARGRRGQQRSHGQKGKVRSQAICYSGTTCQVGPRANLAKCDLSGSAALSGANCAGCNLADANLSRVNARGANLKGANLGKTCLVGADLTGANVSGANVKGAIYCRTTMPDGSLNNSGCGSATNCCPTCNVPPGGSCAAPGSICCDGAVCRDGICDCRNGLTSCDGTCVDTNTDPNNCGECGHVCPDGQACANGGCGGCPAGQEELDNGSCADPCDPGLQDCPFRCFCSSEAPSRPLNFYCAIGTSSQLCFDSSECPAGMGCFSARCKPLCGSDGT